jgi:hypothetical protein
MPEFRSKLRHVIAGTAYKHGREIREDVSHAEIAAALMTIAADYLNVADRGAPPLHPNFTPWLSAAIHEAVETWTSALSRDRPPHAARATALLDLAREALEYHELARRARISSAPYAQSETATQPTENTHARS